MTEDKDIDLLKIQIYSDRCHTFLTIALSFSFVILGLYGVFAAVYYQGLMTINVPFVYAGWVGMVVIGLIFVIVLLYFLMIYRKDYRRIPKMIEAVKRGEQLPPLNELGKWDG